METTSPQFISLFSQHVGAAFAKQLAFADFLGNRNWSISLSEGRVRFGDDLSYPMQLLGTESQGDSTWLWAWANAQSNIPDPLLTICKQLRQMGKAVPEFGEPNFSLQVADGHRIAMIASGLNPDCCYYRGPYDGGALFFLVNELPKDLTQSATAERVITVINKTISQFEVNHREMVESFLQSQGFTLKPGASRLVASRGSDSLQISFDSQNRMEKVEGSLSPADLGEKKWWQFWK